ncbi:ubiquinone/menaquinone biosynthesis C-methylase UbiE [Homoserinimonas aerilata]|uniref:Ubiquinone/menaquinone biosynthesis C-methylase UbiE n=1 Tax=Homoserinimonas aerilata TaxID=1162970 RepID=A0A542YI34_9MICO|nr:methyltransferase domain-containing protein [Homoserinimonas aerilata]TQL47756.1 ubiquinone/menaquinone biosynthesis C-methylase UbiE [Homoserinimonas aerilata]
MTEKNPRRDGERYSHGHHESVLRSHSWRTVENSAAYLVPSIRPGLEVLDLGCGPGTITVDLARRVAPGRVVGMDAAADVIEKAAAHAREEGVDNVEFVVGDAYATGFDDDSFDVVHAHQVLQHVADPVAVLREARRIVRPGGVVAARDVDYGGTIVHPTTEGIASWADVYQLVHRGNGGEPDAGRRLKQWAREAGFTDVVSTASVWCFSSDEDRDWWGGMWRDRVLQSAFAGDAVSNGHATQDGLQQISDAWQEWALDPNGWMAMPHGEVLGRG